MTSPSILITGGAGFIGRPLVGLFLAQGYRVAVYDNLQVGRLANLTPYQDGITFIRGDVRDRAALDQALETFRPEGVVHLAALHFVPYCCAHPQDTLEVNVTGTYNVLAACARLGIQDLVFASSGALYASETHPLDEERDRPAPVDVYGLSKLLGEQICAYFVVTAGMRCRAARLFNTYGPYETNAHIVPDIVTQLHQGDTLELGNLEPKRDYIFVEDTAAGLLALARSDIPGFDIFNVGTGCEYSVRDLLGAISELTGRRLKVVQSPGRTRQTDKLHQIADVAKLQQRTGFVATNSLTAGLHNLLVSEGLCTD